MYDHFCSGRWHNILFYFNSNIRRSDAYCILISKIRVNFIKYVNLEYVNTQMLNDKDTEILKVSENASLQIADYGNF